VEDLSTYGEAPDEDADITLRRTRTMLPRCIWLIHYGLPTSADPMRATYDSILGVGDLNNVTQTLAGPAN
jgi:hypothetical protein